MKPGSGHGRRHKTPGVVIILTDASASDSVSSSIPALKEVADRVIVVGMGYAVDKQQLNQIASNPDRENYIEVYSSQSLKSKVKQVTDAICETKVCTSLIEMTHNNDELRYQIQCHVDQQDAKICVPHRIADQNVCVRLAHWEVMDDHAQVIN